MPRHPAADLRLGVRLAVAAGRGGIAQLGLVTVGVAVGVSLLLLVLTVSPALQARQDRTAWHGTSAATAPARGAASGDGLWWLASQDHYRGRDVLRAAPSTGPPGR